LRALHRCPTAYKKNERKSAGERQGVVTGGRNWANWHGLAGRGRHKAAKNAVWPGVERWASMARKHSLAEDGCIRGDATPCTVVLWAGMEFRLVSHTNWFEKNDDMGRGEEGGHDPDFSPIIFIPHSPLLPSVATPKTGEVCLKWTRGEAGWRGNGGRTDQTLECQGISTLRIHPATARRVILSQAAHTEGDTGTGAALRCRPHPSALFQTPPSRSLLSVHPQTDKLALMSLSTQDFAGQG